MMQCGVFLSPNRENRNAAFFIVRGSNVRNCGDLSQPTIQREINACNESDHRTHGTLQIKLGKKYKTAAKLADRIECHKAKIKELKGHIPRALAEEESRERKHGEEKLSISQVQNRRWRKYERLKEISGSDQPGQRRDGGGL